jgi:hypothetical protein
MVATVVFKQQRGSSPMVQVNNTVQTLLKLVGKEGTILTGVGSITVPIKSETYLQETWVSVREKGVTD